MTTTEHDRLMAWCKEPVGCLRLSVYASTFAASPRPDGWGGPMTICGDALRALICWDQALEMGLTPAVEVMEQMTSEEYAKKDPQRRLVVPREGHVPVTIWCAYLEEWLAVGAIEVL